MKIDELGCLVMEHSSPEGNLGDSCAESSRLDHMNYLLGKSPQCNLTKFVTITGYVRHPLVPESWKEKDFSSDQALPLLLCFKMKNHWNGLYADQMRSRIMANYWRTGNNNFVSPGLFAELIGCKWLRAFFLLVQMLLFKFPYRWSDSKKWFESTDGSSGDYLNFIHLGVHAPKWVRRLVSKSMLKQKVSDYYAPEPKSDWLIKIYDEFIEKYFTSSP